LGRPLALSEVFMRAVVARLDIARQRNGADIEQALQAL